MYLASIFSSLYFGIITCVTGVLGVGMGGAVSQYLRKKTPRADPLVCAAGLLLSAPFLYLAIIFAQSSTVATYVSLSYIAISTCTVVAIFTFSLSLFISHITFFTLCTLFAYAYFFFCPYFIALLWHSATNLLFISFRITLLYQLHKVKNITLFANPDHLHSYLIGRS